jgi:hypothetical protein
MPSMRAVRMRAASSPSPKSAPMARTIGYIIAAVAVFEIQSEMKAVATITPSTTRRPPTPIAATIA